MPRNGSGVFSAPAGTLATTLTTIKSPEYNAFVNDLVSDANAARPIVAGGSGATTAVGAADNQSTKGADIASAATTDIGAATGRFVHITGTTTITSFGTKTAGVIRILTFDGALTITHNATSLILPGAANIGTSAGDTAVFVSEGGGNWRCVSYSNLSGAYATKSGNYTAVGTDNGTIHRYTAAATASLTAAATLGLRWTYTIIADGGAVTIDPNASETINGLTTLIVPNGSTAEIICDGSNFFTVIKPYGWQFIEKRDFSAVSAADFTNLAAFRRIRLTGYIVFSGTADLGLRLSTNNGSSFDTGSNYGWQVLAGASTSATAARTNPDTYIILSLPSPTILQFDALVDNMNSGSNAVYVTNRCTEIVTSNFGVGVTGGASGTVTAKNAIRLFPTAGTMTGNVTIEGMV